MAATASNVRVGVTGAVYVAPSGTDLPNDATSSLPSALQDVGYISEDGVSESHGTDSNDIRAWQNGDLVRRVQTSHDVTFGFTMLETNQITLREYYGNYDDGVIKVTGNELPHRVWVLSVIDGDHVFRIVIPNGQVTERGDITYSGTDAIGREVTLTAFPVPDPDDPNGDPVKALIYLTDDATDDDEEEG